MNQGLDIVCYKFDAVGNELWSTPSIFGRTGAQQSYVCNAKTDQLYIGEGFYTGLVNTCDMLLLKIAPDDGSLIWDKSRNFAGGRYNEIDGLDIGGDEIILLERSHKR